MQLLGGDFRCRGLLLLGGREEGGDGPGGLGEEVGDVDVGSICLSSQVLTEKAVGGARAVCTALERSRRPP